MHVLIPCKHLGLGKSRLSECLDPRGRRELCERLLLHTLRYAVVATDESRIRVVSSDPDVASIAERFRIPHIWDPGKDLNAALDYGRTTLLAETPNADALLVLPTDLPFANADAVAAISREADVTIVPDEAGTGTNAILLRSSAIREIRFAFGPYSCSAHFEHAKSRGFSVAVVQEPRLAFDLDSATDYLRWRQDSISPTGSG